MTDSEKLIKLKELLLNEDRVFAQQILDKLDSLEETVTVPEKLSEKVNPIIDKKLDQFVEDIPDRLGPTIAEALTKSQDKVVEALFPIIGKMIKKYIQQEIKALSDAINGQVQSTFSIKTWQRKFKALFTGVSEKEIILSEMNQTNVEQLFLIEKGSGLIISSASKQESIDEDMIAGMLTAIKSFVEDAFKKDQQSLELIQYELFEIYIQNFTSYYFAVVISGGFNLVYKNRIENRLFDLASEIHLDTIDREAIAVKLRQIIENE
ncbi:cell envelope biogenesis protein OmpA [Flavobacterium sp. SUN046]|uniref:cell envelope biogenesis protein OmpA n=1 Tax=Flavobacterium sp. SUN046 TaxID=3002440 RepID=UPI002DB93C17|nr:cell envelope biogenesis protein OmpA [Flavobacterium sp. SUN046]MEC4047884.1 cell envelope biogenesis protein OmpA [Flavobacterium sp. SUN046]